ncbi:MAG: filamentous hemagglutinin N-terminal domain-containing protein, partial [Leptolyngbyaceae cyanobacterium CAN_BIN12]|nr:filamentous hemagglutinin N-terminal domain-containing protein [Leptolyngbyaceae cyanobacterium CAN_BIN12]
MKGRLWRNIGVGAIAFGVGAIAFAESAGAQSQIVPDETLGAERSRVTPETIRGVESDRITGGASREANLFHSFTQFDIGEGRGAYFENPAGIQNIFSRITGNDISDINGTLGVLGSANLFLMNPNGIVFGQNARLDLGGSFVGTTANAIGFGDGGIFSASMPDVPGQVLNVNPSALLFNQMGNGAIASQAKELASASGQSLLFAGGDVSLDASLLFSLGGRVELSRVAGIGTIPIISSGNALQLGFVSGGSLADIALQNNSFISTPAGGSIVI